MSESHGHQSWRQNAEASSSRSHPRRPSSPPPVRYPGDGLDFRRPAQSTSQDAVIDLTNEPDSPPQTIYPRGTASQTGARQPRPPRFGRPIMTEVVDLEEEPEASGQDDIHEIPSSPEVQFIGSSVRPSLPRERSFGTNLLHMLHFHDSRMHGVPHRDVFREEVARRARQIAQRPPLEMDALWVGGPGSAIDLTSFNLDMDYMLRSLTSPDNGPPSSSYKPPSPAPEGFTRTAGEEEVVCCPNCDSELGTGDEMKQQIWVARQCGHVSILYDFLPLCPSMLTPLLGVLWRMCDLSVEIEREEGWFSTDQAIFQMSSLRLREISQCAESDVPNLSLENL